jgi:hypothetical protein
MKRKEEKQGRKFIERKEDNTTELAQPCVACSELSHVGL